MIIGITGTLGAGKGAIVDFLVKEKGFVHLSVRDFLTQEVRRRNLPLDRDSLTLVGNDLRAQHSPSYIVDELLSIAVQSGKNTVIESIRAVGELQRLRTYPDFTLFAVDAAIETRFKRIQIRKSETDKVDFDTFKSNEQREMQTTDPNKPNLSRCIAMADYAFDNNTTIPALQQQVERALHDLANPIQCPVAQRIPHCMETHGVKRVDDYYWMNKRDDPQVLDYLKAENTYTKYQLKNTETLQQSLFEEIKGRMKEDDESVPFFKNKYWYYTRFEKGKEYPIYCRKYQTKEAKEEIVLDVNVLAQDQKYCQVTELMISDDNRVLAYAVDFVGRRIYDIYFRDLQTGQVSTDVIRQTTGDFTWTKDNKTLFFVRQNKQLRPYKLFKYRTNTPQEEEEIYHEKDAKFDIGIGRSRSEDYILLFSSSTLSSECRYIHADKPDEAFTMFQRREKEMEYGIEHVGDCFYIITNWNAKNFRLMKTPIHATSKEHWEEVIPHRPEVYLEDFEVFRDFLVLEERHNALNRIRIKRFDATDDYYIPVNEEVYDMGVGYNPEFNTDVLRYGYTSLTTPVRQMEWNMQTKTEIVLKQQVVLDASFRPDNYESKRLWAVSHDGTKVPISIVYRKDCLQKDDIRNPLLLYGYGSYGYSMDANFGSARLSLLDRGFIYAIAHIRGGEEMGRYWYEDGKFLKKKNTFLDFIACAEYLINAGYTTADRLNAMGGSAGGLLIGAVANMRPDLFNTLIAQVPFVDVVTTMLDDSIPLTAGEYEEWGNPNDKAYFDYMLSYSPYDNVQPQNYPNMLITAGYHDSQVQYWEPAKWVAKLRTIKTDKHELLLHTEMDFGHSGASGRFESIKETAMEYAFLLRHLK